MGWKPLVKTVDEVPEHIINDLYSWLRGPNLNYLRYLHRQNNLIKIHIIGGGMDVRNFLRKYGDHLDLYNHWLDDNWIAIVQRMFKDKEKI